MLVKVSLDGKLVTDTRTITYGELEKATTKATIKFFQTLGGEEISRAGYHESISPDGSSRSLWGELARMPDYVQRQSEQFLN